MIKRQLTRQERLEIINELKLNIPNNIQKQINYNQKRQLFSTLQKIQIYPECFPLFKKKIIDHYYQSQITPGESVGIICAQSIGEKLTQLTLNSFHYTGSAISTVVSGVPRFKELLGVTKNPKSVVTKIYFNVENINNLSDIRDLIGNSLVEINFKKCVKKYTLNNDKDNIWISCFVLLFGIPVNILDVDIILEFELDIELLYLYKIDISFIASQLNDITEIQNFYCIGSPNTIGRLYVLIWNLNKENLNFIISKLYETLICGIKGIQEIYYKKDNNIWYIEALGENLQSLFCLNIIDKYKTISNNMHEINRILGIEAVREFLIKEFTEVISADSYIDPRHIQLLVDSMLYTGNILSISRYGMEKEQFGTLTKASFEQSMKHFINASVYNEIDDVNGVSSSIICGNPVKIGTGFCDLLYKNFN